MNLSLSAQIHISAFMRMCACLYVRSCVHVFIHACLCVHVWACAHIRLCNTIPCIIIINGLATAT